MKQSSPGKIKYPSKTAEYLFQCHQAALLLTKDSEHKLRSSMTANSVTRNRCTRSLVSLILALTCCGTAITHAADETAGEHQAAEPSADSAGVSSSNATKSYVVHVGAFAVGKSTYATAMANKIKAADIIADQSELSVYRNRGLVKVRLGPYADYGKAMNIMAKLKKLDIESVLGNNPDLPVTTPPANVGNTDSRAKPAKNGKQRAQEDSATDSPADSAASSSNATKSYVVHVGAFALGKRAYATAMANKIKAADIITDQSELSVYRNRGLMKVRLGPYADYSKAMSIMAKLKKLGVASVLGNNIDLPATAPPTLEALQIRMEELDARNAQLQQRVLELEQRPVTESAAEPSPTEQDDGAEAGSPAEQRTAEPREKDVTRSTAVGTNRDDRRPTDQLNVELFGRPLTIGGEYELSLEDEHNFELDTDDNDDVTFMDLSWTVELFYEISDTVSIFIDGTAFHTRDFHVEEDGERFSAEGLERGQAWLLIEELFDSNFAVRIGPQFFSEDREWFWDELLDGISLQYEGEDFYAEIGIAEQLLANSTTDDGIDPEDDDLLRVIARASWDWAYRQSLEFFFLSQNDRSDTEAEGDVIREKGEDESDADLYWWGVRAAGRLKFERAGRFYYWLDAAIVRGEETVIDFDDFEPEFRVADETFEHDVNGWATDVGVTWQTRLPLRPSITLRYAYGSGDPNDSLREDRSFRQTGLQGNNDRFRGVNGFRYYGELLDPELSNLRIATASLGLPLLDNSSLEILYHRYDQDRAAPFLRSASIEEDPSGLDKDIGQEVDLVLGLEEWEHLELELIAALFRAGDAYDSLVGERATHFIVKVNYNF